MPTQLFDKQKVKIEYDFKKITLNEDASVKKYSGGGKDALLKTLNDGKHWTAKLEIDKKGKATAVPSVGYPVTNNGHVEGKGWKYQLDAGEKGGGSVDRLILDKVTPKIGKQEEKGSIKVGKDSFTLLKVELELTANITVKSDTH